MRTLFLTHRLPYAPNRGDRIRAYHLLKAIAAFSEIDLVSFVHDEAEASSAGELEGIARVTTVPVVQARNLARAVVALPGTTPLTHVLLDSPGLGPALSAAAARRPDLVFAYCSGMARCALEPPLEGLPFVLDMVDVDSQKWSALGASAWWPQRWIYRREARTLAAFEALATRRARTTLVVNDRERTALTALAPDGRVEVVENGVDLTAFRPPVDTGPNRTATVVFSGVMNYAPNESAVLWFATEVWPSIRDAVPGARFAIVGSSPTRAVMALSSADASITVTGTVPDVRPFLWRASVSVAPLKVARGVQNKVLEALAAGLPVVVTSPVIEGVPDAARPGCRVTDDAALFAREVIQLLVGPQAELRALAASANLEPLSWERSLAPLRGILTAAAGA
jgi:polysaccharide biosynthesis protein PslH